MKLDDDKLINLIEAALLVAGRPMTLNQIENLFNHETEKPEREAIQASLVTLAEQYESRGIELVEVASGFRLQARDEYAPWIANLYQEKTPKYSRALIETLVLIAYRQPITRGEIEDVRGVAVSSNIVKTLLERDWVKILGHRDVPGKPALLGTTRQFLDYFNLKRLSDLPTLSEIKDLDQIDPELAKEMALLDSQSEVTLEESDIEATDADSTDTAGEPVTVSADASLDDDAVDALENELSTDDILHHHSGADERLQLEDNDSVDEEETDQTALDLTSDGSLHGMIDVHLELEDADSANDETLAPEAQPDIEPEAEALPDDPSDGGIADNVSDAAPSIVSSEESIDQSSIESSDEAPTMLQAVGESETLH